MLASSSAICESVYLVTIMHATATENRRAGDGDEPILILLLGRPFVQKNFTLVVLGIVVVSVVPIILELLAAKREQGGGASA